LLKPRHPSGGFPSAFDEKMEAIFEEQTDKKEINQKVRLRIAAFFLIAISAKAFAATNSQIEVVDDCWTVPLVR
jgi:hypothetical protein